MGYFFVNYHQERADLASGDIDSGFGVFSYRCPKCKADKFEECTGGGYAPNLRNALDLLSYLFYNASLTEAEAEKIREFFGGTPPKK